MRCDPDCGDCCTIAPATETEFQALRRYVADHGIVPVEQGARCPLYVGGQCAAHPVRPLICRLYGHSKRLKCSRGYAANIREADIDRSTRENGRPTRLVHELLPDYAGWLSRLPEAVAGMVRSAIGTV